VPINYVLCVFNKIHSVGGIGTVKIIFMVQKSLKKKKKLWLLMTVNKLIIANIINKSYIRVLKYLTFRQQ